MLNKGEMGVNAGDSGETGGVWDDTTQVSCHELGMRSFALFAFWFILQYKMCDYKWVCELPQTLFLARADLSRPSGWLGSF